MAKTAMSTEVVRMPKEMRRWVGKKAKAWATSRSEVVRQAVSGMMAQEFAAEMKKALSPACSCAPDDRALHGCKCAEVGR